MSDDAAEIASPQTHDATVLPFPSNRPPDSPGETTEATESPRLRQVIGDVLRDERLRQERTLADVARDAAISLPYLSEVERGIKEVSSDLLDAIGQALDLPLVDVLERSADRLRVDDCDSAEFRMQSTARFQLAA